MYTIFGKLLGRKIQLFKRGMSENPDGKSAWWPAEQFGYSCYQKSDHGQFLFVFIMMFMLGYCLDFWAANSRVSGSKMRETHDPKILWLMGSANRQRGIPRAQDPKRWKLFVDTSSACTAISELGPSTHKGASAIKMNLRFNPWTKKVISHNKFDCRFWQH